MMHAFMSLSIFLQPRSRKPALLSLNDHNAFTAPFSLIQYLHSLTSNVQKLGVYPKLDSQLLSSGYGEARHCAA